MRNEFITIFLPALFIAAGFYVLFHGLILYLTRPKKIKKHEIGLDVKKICAALTAMTKAGISSKTWEEALVRKLDDLTKRIKDKNNGSSNRM